MLARGRSTLQRFSGTRTPGREDGERVGVVVVVRDEMEEGVVRGPGYVRARTTGRAVWRVKKTGRRADCRVENWGRERAR